MLRAIPVFLALTLSRYTKIPRIDEIGHNLIEDVYKRQVSIHYAKKGDLLYPHLKVAYDISGPSMVMWTVDDDIRDGFGRLARAKSCVGAGG